MKRSSSETISRGEKSVIWSFPSFSPCGRRCLLGVEADEGTAGLGACGYPSPSALRASTLSHLAKARFAGGEVSASLAECFNRQVAVRVHADVGGDIQRLAHDGLGVLIGVGQGTRRGERVIAAGTDSHH